MKQILLSLFAFIVCSYTLVQAQNVNQYITVYGHDFHSGSGAIKDSEGNIIETWFEETREIEIKNNSPYTLNIGTVYAYNYSTGDMFFIINYNGNADLPPYSNMYVTIENNSENNKYLSNMWVISVNYMNYNDYGNYSKEVKTKKGHVSNGTSGEFLEDLYYEPPFDEVYEMEPNDSFENANELFGNPIRFNLRSRDDVDYFKVYANVGDEITFKVKYLNYQNLDGGKIFKYSLSDESTLWVKGNFSFDNVESEKEVSIVAYYDSGYYYLGINFENSEIPDYFYSNEPLSVQAFINGNPVSVEKVDKNEVTIYAQNENIHVKDAKGEVVLVYSIDGKLVYNNMSDTDDVSIRLTSGIYIVKVGKITKKVKL